MAGTCTVCGSEASVNPSYNGYEYCEAHFRQLVKRRVRRDLRTNQPLDVKEHYVLKDDGTPLAGLARDLLRDIFGEHLSLGSDPSAEPGPRVIISSCLEQDVSERFERFLAGEVPSLPGVRPLRTVSVEDVNALSGTSLERSSFAHPLLLELDEAQPGSFFAMHNVFKEKGKKKKKKK